MEAVWNALPSGILVSYTLPLHRYILMAALRHVAVFAFGT
jgi:uncharacterized protein YfaA (DUF2138 family)